MAVFLNLKINPLDVIKKPYMGDAEGSFVADSSLFELALLKSSEPQKINGAIWFSSKCAGPPKHVHGGCQAAVLDEVMGSVGWHFGYAVVAAKIEVSFLNMIPVEKQYSVWGRIIQVEKRKVFVEAKIFDSEKTYATSSGLFIQLSESQKNQLAEARSK